MSFFLVLLLQSRELINTDQFGILRIQNIIPLEPLITPRNKNDNSETDSTMTNVITLTELQNATKKLKQGKSAGLDQISNEMIICCVETYPEIFFNLFNSLVHYRVFPETWSQSIIVPIHKKGDKMVETSYRGIALLSCIGKFFNVIINERITSLQ